MRGVPVLKSPDGFRSVPRWSPYLGPVKLAGPPIPLRALGVGINAFPNITTITQGGGAAGGGDFFGFKLQGVGQGIGLSVGGVALSYISRFLPGVAETVALAGGLGMMGFGIYKFYDVVSGKAEPTIQKFNTPVDLPKDAIDNIEGKILEPSNGGQAQLSSMWAQLLSADRTFKVTFAVSNKDQKADGPSVPLIIELETHQESRPLFGEPEISNFSTSYIQELSPGDTKVFPGHQPVAEASSFRSQDVTATLTARTSSNGRKKQLDQVKFTAW